MTGRSICLIKESVVEMHGDDDGCGPGRMTGRMFILLSTVFSPGALQNTSQ